ncbi:MAG TPA: twin transmembrane helix small protein [Caulobacterales bacterium]|nr:twin transmembrane helix small protein [Caulobacterales bacterium]
MNIFSYLIPIALGVVFITLCFGIYALFRGGDFGRSWSNRAMRMRVLAQFVAILVLVAAMLVKQHMMH